MREGGLGGGVVGGGSGEKRDVDGGEVYIYIYEHLLVGVLKEKKCEISLENISILTEFRFERFTKKYKYVQNDQEERNIVVSIASNKEFERRKRTNN